MSEVWAARAPRGHGRMARVEVPGSSQAKQKDGSCNNSCLHPSAKVVQIPRCPESSSDVLHAGASAHQHWDPRFDAMQEEQRNRQARAVTSAKPKSSGILQETG